MELRDNSEIIMKVSMNQLSALLKSVCIKYVLSHFGPTETESLIQIRSNTTAFIHLLPTISFRYVDDHCLYSTE